MVDEDELLRADVEDPRSGGVRGQRLLVGEGRGYHIFLDDWGLLTGISIWGWVLRNAPAHGGARKFGAL